MQMFAWAPPQQQMSRVEGECEMWRMSCSLKKDEWKHTGSNTTKHLLIHSSAVGAQLLPAVAPLVFPICKWIGWTWMFAIKKKYSSPSSQPALRHPLHSHKNNKTPLDNMSPDNVFNSMFTLQLAGSPSQGWNCALASKTGTSDKSGGRPFVLDAGGDGLQTAAGAPPANFLH